MVASDSPSAPRVVVVGITGNQGSSVAQHLVDSAKPYRIVGLTRDPTKPKAQAWTDKGVQLEKINLGVGQEEALLKILKEGDIFFAVTNFEEHGDKEREIAEGKMLVDSAITAKVKLFVWSALWGISDLTKGKYQNVAFFDDKAEVTKYAQEKGVPLALVPCAFFLSNFFSAPYIPTKNEDGTYVMKWPMSPSSKIPIIDTADYGRYVQAAIEVDGLGVGSTVLSGSVTSVGDTVKIISEVSGIKVTYEEVDKDTFLELPSIKQIGSWGVMVYEMFRFYEEEGYYGTDDLEASLKQSGVKPRTFEEQVKRYHAGGGKLLQ